MRGRGSIASAVDSMPSYTTIQNPVCAERSSRKSVISTICICMLIAAVALAQALMSVMWWCWWRWWRRWCGKHGQLKPPQRSPPHSPTDEPDFSKQPKRPVFLPPSDTASFVFLYDPKQPRQKWGSPNRLQNSLISLPSYPNRILFQSL